MLKVRPRITADGSIQLKLYQEVSSIQSDSSTQGPTTNKRSIDTTVVVDDKHIVVLGGLMQDTFENNVDKVPLLGDLPVLGNLFKSKTRSQVKTDLFVFLRPVVVRNRQVLDALSKPRYDYALGRYGKAPGTVNEEVRKMAVGNQDVITCRPADRIGDELAKMNRRLDNDENFLRLTKELSTLNESLQALAYAALGTQAPQVRRRRAV